MQQCRALLPGRHRVLQQQRALLLVIGGVLPRCQWRVLQYIGRGDMLRLVLLPQWQLVHHMRVLPRGHHVHRMRVLPHRV